MNSVEYVKQFPLRMFKRGELLLQKESPITTLMAIRSGFVKVSSITDEGVERLVWLAGRYDIAPTEQLFTRHGSTRFFYTALTDGSYYEIDKKAFLEAAYARPELMTEIARSMSLHYDDFLYRVDAVDTATVKEKLLRTLCYLAERLDAGPRVNLYEHGLRLTHADIAAMIGSTRETTSLTLNILRKEGLLTYDRHQLTIDVERLKNAF